MHLGGFVLGAIGFALIAALIGVPAVWIAPVFLAILAFGALSTLARSRSRHGPPGGADDPPGGADDPPAGGPAGLP